MIMISSASASGYTPTMLLWEMQPGVFCCLTHGVEVMRSPSRAACLRTAECVDKQACFVHPVSKMKDGLFIVWCECRAMSNIEQRACCVSPCHRVAAACCALMLPSEVAAEEIPVQTRPLTVKSKLWVLKVKCGRNEGFSVWCSFCVFPQKKLQEASLKSTQRLKDAEKELRYVVRYIKVGGFILPQEL